MNKIINKLAVVSVAVGSCGLAHAATPDQKVIEQYNQNSIYNCDAKELSAYIKEATKPLFAPLPVPNAKQLVKIEKKKGEDPCLDLFSNMNAMKDMQKVMDIISNLHMPSMPNMDGVAAAAAALAKKMSELSMQSVCNAATKTAAKELIDKAMTNTAGFARKELKGFDRKAYAKKLLNREAEHRLGVYGIDKKWLYGENKADYRAMFKEEVKTQRDAEKKVIRKGMKDKFKAESKALLKSAGQKIKERWNKD